MTSKQMRDNPLFMRNEFEPSGKWGLPLIHKQELNVPKIDLIACSDTKANDRIENIQKGVHFFVDDYWYNGIYENHVRTFERFSQYAFLLST